MKFFGELMFKSDMPIDLPELPALVNIRNSDLTDLLIEARTALAELKGYALSIPNPMLLLSPAIIKESLASSNIENINTTLENVLENELFPEIERKQPDKEVLRYRDAVLYAFDEIKTFPLSNRIILGIHFKLIPEYESVYRKTQNYIKNTLTNEIIYTPPLANKIPELISNWEKFVNSEESNFDPLLRAIIAHYQFEAIHPYGDGNGRTGRILLLMQLIKNNILDFPIFYISGYINRNRERYYEVLRNVTKNNNWLEYAAYMLNTIYLQSLDTKFLIQNILGLHIQIKNKIKQENPKIYSKDLIDILFSYPIITPVKLGRLLNIHYTTASRYLKELSAKGTLHEFKTSKYHLFINNELMDILNK